MDFYKTPRTVLGTWHTLHSISYCCSGVWPKWAIKGSFVEPERSSSSVHTRERHGKGHLGVAGISWKARASISRQPYHRSQCSGIPSAAAALESQSPRNPCWFSLLSAPTVGGLNLEQRAPGGAETWEVWHTAWCRCFWWKLRKRAKREDSKKMNFHSA